MCCQIGTDSHVPATVDGFGHGTLIIGGLLIIDHPIGQVHPGRPRVQVAGPGSLQQKKKRENRQKRVNNMCVGIDIVSLLSENDWAADVIKMHDFFK